MSPEATCTMHAVIALLRTMRGVDEAKVQAVTTFLGIAIDEAEKAA